MPNLITLLVLSGALVAMLALPLSLMSLRGRTKQTPTVNSPADTRLMPPLDEGEDHDRAA
jgi:hypothetical protein